MKVLITGSGGREHALAWACSRSPVVERVYVAPGNGGTEELGTNVAISSEAPEALAAFCLEEGIDLVVLGTDGSVAAGVGDAMRANGIPCFGPNRAAGQIESSKAFSKQLMADAGIPTAPFGVFTDHRQAKAFADRFEGRVAVKADGLALGKGVIICHDPQEAGRAIDRCLREAAFGDAGRTIVVEQLLSGRELSVFGITDGVRVLPFAAARDYKRALDGDQGPNTGGMGAYSPPVDADDALIWEAVERVLTPAVRALADRGMRYRGVLYAGLMLTDRGMMTLEFNARFGDPEAQAIFPRFRGDLLPLLLAAANGDLLGQLPPAFDPRPAVAIVVASGGYPERYATGFLIDGVDDMPENAYAFHAGTRREATGLVTTSGRVVTVVAMDEDVAGARRCALEAASRVAFSRSFYRTDIAKEAEEAAHA